MWEIPLLTPLSQSTPLTDSLPGPLRFTARTVTHSQVPSDRGIRCSGFKVQSSKLFIAAFFRTWQLSRRESMPYRGVCSCRCGFTLIFRQQRLHSVATRRTPAPHETEKAPSNVKPRLPSGHGPGSFAHEVLVSIPGFVFTGGRTDFTPHPERHNMYVARVSG